MSSASDETSERLRFISFEGGEGSGKTTQIRRLAHRLSSLSQEVVVSREPGGSPGAESLRQLLVTGEADRWSPLAETLILYAAREDHLQRTIRPALARGAWVLTDRFADSTRAYQGVAGATSGALIRLLEQVVICEDWPSLTFILDLTPERGLQRATARGDLDNRFESKGLAFHQRLRAAFLDIAAADPKRCCIIDASADVDTIADQIWRCVCDHFGLLTSLGC